MCGGSGGLWQFYDVQSSANSDEASTSYMHVCLNLTQWSALTCKVKFECLYREKLIELAYVERTERVECEH